MSTDWERVCQACGALLPAESDFCPICLLRGAVTDENARSATVNQSTILSETRFEHYEILTGQDGRPFELGRGAMGVTYKAVDLNLRCDVALKLINAGLIGDDSVRRRFVREARAAASVRHPNVASIFHLGKSGENYFYAMEFVDGEPLEELIRRSVRLEPKLALQILTQVVSGLSAVHKQNLVHRDIKPSNIIVSLDDGTIAKIIDLGLAKAVAGSESETTVSTPGSFAGTPEFASPEQFAGVAVDIRSDLYSLGATLWNMLTGQPPFRGSSAELMHQHLHAPLPTGKLDYLPQPVIALIETLLEKDPVRRFQNPVELLKALPMITDAIDTGLTITRQSLRQTPSDIPAENPKVYSRRRPDKISLGRLPITASQVFGREEDIAFLDAAWADTGVNVLSIVAWAGVGKSTLVNHWLQRMAAGHYRSAELVFGWSFYRQGTSGPSASADEFLDAALAWFGDPDPRVGTAWEKGERLANLIAHRRTLLILDGLEPLQYPPGPQEGRLREPSLQALLRELVGFNLGLCLITTRMPVADIADRRYSSAPRRDLEYLASESGSQLLRAVGVRGNESELRSASEEFNGHCLALTLLGSYLTDVFDGDIRFRNQLSQRLGQDVRQGAHVRKVMESYQSWFGEGAELSVLRMLGLFDRPIDEKTLRVLLEPPAIGGLTESISDLSPIQWRTTVAKLRRARLVAAEDPNNPGHLDTHPLVREFFGEQLRRERLDAWRECNRRLYNYYVRVAPQFPETFRDMEPLFLATICGCNAGLYREALHEIYIARIQRGNTAFAANVLGARGALLLVLIHFFADGHWGAPLKNSVEGQTLTVEDQLFILTQAGLHLTATQGMGAPEVRTCYDQAEILCHSLNRPLLLYSALRGQWRYSLMTDNLSATMQIAKRIYTLAQGQNDPELMVGACGALACTFYFSGNFESAIEYAARGVGIWHSGSVESPVEEVDPPVVACLFYKSLCEWHFGEISSCQATMAEAIALAKELNDMHGLAEALVFGAYLAVYERKPTEVERLASDLVELSTRHNFAFWLAGGAVFRGWARSVSGDTAEGLAWIEDGIRDWRATGSMLGVPVWLGLKAEALHLATRTAEALEALREAEAVVERSEERIHCTELHRLRGVFLTAMGADETQIEGSFCAALRIAREQKSVSLEKRAEANYAEFRRQKGDHKSPPSI